MSSLSVFFFFNDTATTEIYTPFPTRRSSDLSGRPEVGARLEGRVGVVAPQPLRRLYGGRRVTLGEVQLSQQHQGRVRPDRTPVLDDDALEIDRKSTRLNSSHGYISYAVFCLK